MDRKGHLYNPMACIRVMWMLLLLTLTEASQESNTSKKEQLKLELKNNFSTLTLSNDTRSMAKPLLRGRQENPPQAPQAPQVLGNSSTRTGPRDAVCAGACAANSAAYGCSQDGVCLCWQKANTYSWKGSVQVLNGRGCGGGNTGLTESCQSLCKNRNWPWYTCDAISDCTCSLYAPSTTSSRC